MGNYLIRDAAGITADLSGINGHGAMEAPRRTSNAASEEPDHPLRQQNGRPVALVCLRQSKVRALGQHLWPAAAMPSPA
jgi:hypothetical protein